MSENNKLNESDDIEMYAANNQGNNDYDHVESTVIKRD